MSQLIKLIIIIIFSIFFLILNLFVFSLSLLLLTLLYMIIEKTLLSIHTNTYISVISILSIINSIVFDFFVIYFFKNIDFYNFETVRIQKHYTNYLIPQDVYESYILGVVRLLELIGTEHPNYIEALGYQNQLVENILLTRRYRNTSARQAERSEIIEQLNRLAMATLKTSFNSLCPHLRAERQIKSKS